MKEAVLLGLDVGTTFSEAAIVSADGAELSQGRRRTPWQPVPTGAEIAADALLGAVATAARAANDQRPTTNDQRPTTNDQRPTTNDQRPTGTIVGVGMDWASQPIQAPDPAGAAAFEPAFTTYAELYPKLRPVFRAGGA